MTVRQILIHGKFCINEADKDKLMDKLENAHEMSKEQQ